MFVGKSININLKVYGHVCSLRFFFYEVLWFLYCFGKFSMLVDIFIEPIALSLDSILECFLSLLRELRHWLGCWWSIKVKTGSDKFEDSARNVEKAAQLGCAPDSAVQDGGRSTNYIEMRDSRVQVNRCNIDRHHKRIESNLFDPDKRGIQKQVERQEKEPYTNIIVTDEDLREGQGHMA